MRRAKLLFLAAGLTGALLTGCASQKTSKFSPAEDCVYIDKDGSISSALVETYEGEAVDAKDLEQYLKAAIIRYNKANGGQEVAENQSGNTEKLPVALQSVTVKDNTMKVLLDYASAEDLIKFRQTDDNADESNSISSIMVNPAGELTDLVKPDGSKPSVEELKALDGATTVTVEGGGRLMFSGKVLFVTEGTEKIDEYTVVVPDEKISSIVFK